MIRHVVAFLLGVIAALVFAGAVTLVQAIISFVVGEVVAGYIVNGVLCVLTFYFARDLFRTLTNRN